MNRKDLWKRLFVTHPFDGVDPSLLPRDTDGGWRGGKNPVFDIALMDAELVIEVGSWKGTSAIDMCDKMVANGVKDPLIICVDTFLGGVEHWRLPENATDNSYHNLHWLEGRPDIYHYFMSNVFDAGHHERILPFTQTSTNAARILHLREKIQADTIYIDGSHEYSDVLIDLHAYWPIVKDGGIMFGDDWAWPTVRKAVEEFAEEKKIEIEVYEDCFWMLNK